MHLYAYTWVHRHTHQTYMLNIHILNICVYLIIYVILYIYIHTYIQQHKGKYILKNKCMFLILLIWIEHTDFRFNVYLIREITFFIGQSFKICFNGIVKIYFNRWLSLTFFVKIVCKNSLQRRHTWVRHQLYIIMKIYEI